MIILIGVAAFVFVLKPHFVMPARRNRTVIIRLSYVVYGMSLLCCAFLPLNIRFPQQQTFASQDIYLQVLLDVSLSMAVDDIPPSRFFAAKQLIDEIMSRSDHMVLSVISFSEIPTLTIPFSREYSAVHERLESLTLGSFPPTNDFLGTAIGDALLLGIDNLSLYEEDHQAARVVLLITDGDTSAGLDPLTVATLADEKGIPVYTLAVGEDHALLGYDRNDEAVFAFLNTQMLENIASTTQALSFSLDGSTDSALIIDSLVEDFQKVQYATSGSYLISINQWLGRVVFVCFLVYFGRKIAIYRHLKTLV